MAKGDGSAETSDEMSSDDILFELDQLGIMRSASRHQAEYTASDPTSDKVRDRATSDGERYAEQVIARYDILNNPAIADLFYEGLERRDDLITSRLPGAELTQEWPAVRADLGLNDAPARLMFLYIDTMVDAMYARILATCKTMKGYDNG